MAVTRKLVAQGRIPRDESIVICVTGNGYKTLEAVIDSVEQPVAHPGAARPISTPSTPGSAANREASAG